jgi:putative cell wall-binding protein
MSVLRSGRRRDAAALLSAAAVALLPVAAAHTAVGAEQDQRSTAEAPGFEAAALPDWVTITNGTVTLGVWNSGELNVPAGVPQPADPAGSTDVGLRFVPTGNEATAVGCLCEGWGLADVTSGVSGSAYREFGVPSNLRVDSFSATGSSAVSVVTIGNGAGQDVMRVVHDYHPSTSPNLYEVRVTVTNVSGAAVDPLYRRVTDWDAQPTGGAEWMTIQGADATPHVQFASNDGLASPDPLAGPSDLGWTGDFEDQGPLDHGSLFDIGLEPIPAGGTVSFTTYYGAAATEAAAGTAVSGVGATAWAYAQPSTQSGPADGAPNTFVYAVGTVGEAHVERWGGADRYAVSALVSEQWAPGVPVAYVTSGQKFPDALTGGALAGFKGAPLLLVEEQGVPAFTAAALDRLRPARIVVLGGPATVAPQVETALAAYATANTADEVTRLFGIDRYEAAEAIAGQFGTNVPVAYIAKGTDFPDALAGGPRAALEGGPVLLTSPDALPVPTREALLAAAPARIVILGGTDSVTQGVAAELAAYTQGTVTRHDGTDRYDVAALIAGQYTPPAPVVFIATGEKFPDALSAGPAAARWGGPIMLTQFGELPARTVQELERLNPARIVILGGPLSVSPEVEAALKAYIN